MNKRLEKENISDKKCFSFKYINKLCKSKNDIIVHSWTAKTEEEAKLHLQKWHLETHGHNPTFIS